MRSFANQKMALLLCGAALGLTIYAASNSAANAQAQTVDGRNVASISFDGTTGTETIASTGDKRWDHVDGRGQLIASLNEIQRDDWSVYLQNAARDTIFQIDLFTGKVTTNSSAAGRRELGTIASRSMQAGPRQTAMSAATPSPAPTPRVTPTPTPAPTPAPGTGDADFDPFADPSDPADTAATPSSEPRDNRSIITSAANKQPAFTQRVNDTVSAAAKPAFNGQWIAEGKEAESSGNGIDSAITWAFPEALWINTATDRSISIHFDANPNGSITLTKVGEGQFSGSGYSANFAVIDKKNIRLTLTGGSSSREFRIATVPSGAKLSRSRIQPETDEEIDTFTAGNLVPRFNDMFFSYRSEKMDLFSSQRGVALRIFKAPGTTDFSIESNFQSKTIPYGLRAKEIRVTEGKQLESMITNMASFEKSMSMNFGVTGSFKGATFAADASREVSSGAERSDGGTKAFGVARTEIYVLFLDKPNMLLDPGFKYDVLQLAENRMTAQAFRSKYGTHYANAIHYGGIGKNQRTVTTAEYKRWAKESTSYKQEGGFDGGPAATLKSRGGFTQASGNSNGGNSMFSSETWTAVGGSGSMGPNGWNVDQTNTVPVRYDLRPLSELISPMFFGEEWSSPKRAGLLNARAMLDREITSHMQSQPQPLDRNFGPTIYELTFHSLECVNNGDEGRAAAGLYGKITARLWEIDAEPTSLVLFNNPTEGDDQMVKCDGSPGIPINQTVYLTSLKTGTDRNKHAAFQITTEGLFENDNSFTDLDDPIQSMKQNDPRGILAGVNPTFAQQFRDIGWLYLKDWKADSPRTDLAETVITNSPGVSYGPNLRIRVSFKEVQ